MNCNIVGDGNKLVLKKGASLGVLNGEMSGVVIETSGTPVFTTLAGTLSDVTVNVNANAVAGTDSAFIALTNYGVLDNVTLNVSGKLSAVEDKGSTADELVFGGMVMNNSFSYNFFLQRVYGTIQNCTVNYSDFTLSGAVAANASFGGIAGVNSGIVKDCTVTGAITADTFDLAGACYTNRNLLSGIVNEANLKQTAESEDWTPIVGGIAIENSSQVERCTNNGNIAVEGSDIVIGGGIVARTTGQNSYCISTGDISAKGQGAYVGGIFGRSEVTSSNMYVYCGHASYCLSTGRITATLGESTACVGGIGGLVLEGAFTQYKYDEDGSPMTGEDGKYLTEVVYFGGGINNCIFMGTIVANTGNVGGILGVCGADVYEQNSYTSDGVEYANFEGNYYLESAGSSLPPFGAVVTMEEEFIVVEGKGSTSATEEQIKNTETYRKIMGEDTEDENDKTNTDDKEEL